MKKVFTILTAVLCMNCMPAQSFASPSGDTEEQNLAVDLDFSVGIDVYKGNTGHPKTPPLKPRVLQFGHTLQLISGCSESTLVVTDEFDAEVLSMTIVEGCPSVTLPDTLSGSYVVHIHRGAFCFYATIEL